METVFEGIEFIDPPRVSSWLEQAPAPIASWFRRRCGEPTEIQRAAWSRLPAGKHLLLSAPTGTGKTLAAFLPILTQLIQQRCSEEETLTCLYVSPLKALSADTERTLSMHLEEMSALMQGASCRLLQCGAVIRQRRSGGGCGGIHRTSC